MVDNVVTYKVERAIIMAAGLGSRLLPITDVYAKPLVHVNGKRIIDSLIDALVDAGIKEIIIVRGYKKEQFDILLEKYPFVKFIDNPDYDKANNISSIVHAIDYVDNCYICEADLYIRNPEVIKSHQENSNILGFATSQTDDWAFKVKDGLVYDYKLGNANCYQFYGITYWSSEDCKKLREDIMDVWNNYENGHDYFWDNVPLQLKKENYKVYLRECKESDICEIDSFDELAAIDPSYLEN